MSASLKLITTTVSSEDQAVTIIRTLLDERLIACGNIMPAVRSLYRWEGKVCDEAEVAFLLKTTPANAVKTMERLEELHPYDVPAIELWDVAGANLAFLNWVHKETQ